MEKEEWIRFTIQIIIIIIFCIIMVFTTQNNQKKQCNMVFNAYNDCVEKYNHNCVYNPTSYIVNPLMNITVNYTGLK